MLWQVAKDRCGVPRAAATSFVLSGLTAIDVICDAKSVQAGRGRLGLRQIDEQHASLYSRSPPAICCPGPAAEYAIFIGIVHQSGGRLAMHRNPRRCPAGSASEIGQTSQVNEGLPVRREERGLVVPGLDFGQFLSRRPDTSKYPKSGDGQEPAMELKVASRPSGGCRFGSAAPAAPNCIRSGLRRRFRLSTQLLVHFGLEFSFVDTASVDAVNGTAPNTNVVETPTNPTLRVSDIAAIAALANERKIR